jgi:hypothetical protein
MADMPPYPGAPRWVKVLGIVALALALLLVAHHLTGGGHGPWEHFHSGAPEPGRQQP